MDGPALSPKDREPPRLVSQTRPDGTILVRQEAELGAFARCITERFLHWARVDPDRLWMA